MSMQTDNSPVVLLVEDEALLRWSAAGILEDKGFEVLEAEDAEAALKVMRSRPDVRLLFTDVQMPGSLDGMDLARKVHEQWPKVKLLITSGNAKPAEADIPDHGHFLGKPYRAQDVIREVNHLLSGAVN